MTIETTNLVEKSTKLKPYCHHAGEDDYISVTEWSNGEGKTVEVTTRENKTIHLTWGEFQAITVLWNIAE